MLLERMFDMSSLPSSDHPSSSSSSSAAASSSSSSSSYSASSSSSSALPPPPPPPPPSLAEVTSMARTFLTRLDNPLQLAPAVTPAIAPHMTAKGGGGAQQQGLSPLRGDWELVPRVKAEIQGLVFAPPHRTGVPSFPFISSHPLPLFIPSVCQ